MHKYIPRLHVVQTTNSSKASFDNVNMFVFPETQFIAVTAYQNENVNNPVEPSPFANRFSIPILGHSIEN